MAFWDPLSTRKFDQEPFEFELNVRPYFLKGSQGVHRAAVRPSDLLAGLVAIVFTVLTILVSIVILSDNNNRARNGWIVVPNGGRPVPVPKQVGALTIVPLIGYGVAILAYATGVICRLVFASTLFFQGPIGRQWMKLAGTSQVWTARVVAFLFLSLNAGIVYVVWLFYRDWVRL